VLFRSLTYSVAREDYSDAVITIVYDHGPTRPGFRAGSGFACLVRAGGDTVLFDTGAYAPILLHNIEAAGARPQDISAIVLSHLDIDHYGGLFKFLEVNHAVSVYVPDSTSSGFMSRITAYGASVTAVSRATTLSHGIISIGTVGDHMKEQALAVVTPKGSAVLIADAHPGVISMMQETHRSLPGGISIVLGGLHLEEAPDQEIASVICAFRDMGVEQVALCHSTAARAKELFEQAYQDLCLPAGPGLEVRL